MWPDSSMTYATPLRIEPRTSRQAAAWLLLVHGAGLMLLPFLVLPTGLRIMFFIMSVGLFCLGWSRHVRRTCRDAIQSFTWYAGEDCSVVYGDGIDIPCTLINQAFIMPWLVILYYRQAGRRRSLFILPDMLPASTFRRLRVRLNTELDHHNAARQMCARTR